MKAWLSEIEAGFLVPLHIKTLYGKDVELLRKEQKVVFFQFTVLSSLFMSLSLSLFLKTLEFLYGKDVEHLIKEQTVFLSILFLFFVDYYDLSLSCQKLNSQNSLWKGR